LSRSIAFVATPLTSAAVIELDPDSNGLDSSLNPMGVSSW
jgi:hypothetical protein